MEWLNYHHLQYFWTVAKEGSIARACEKLRLAQPTISGQLRVLEDTLGEKLFAKSGRGLVLTEVGQVVYRYADEIFGLGRELQDVLKGRPRGRPLRLIVGVSDMVPKLIAHRVLQPALSMAEPVQLICEEDSPERLMSELAEHRLDIVLSDIPVSSIIRVKAFNHLLGSCGVKLFGAHTLASRYRRDFPASLDGAPLLLPIEGSSMRRSLEQWLDSHQVRPRIVGEFKDSALMKAFGQAGAGMFAAPDAIEKEVCEHYRVEAVGTVDSVTERFYAISVERKLKHPAVVTISEAARGTLFA
ncbi:MAG: transcriptional activator NhaR [Bryobacteraceae bacterium]|nr:transcriptional activator NhaR [Bryobacteraceae bacterium]